MTGFEATVVRAMTDAADHYLRTYFVRRDLEGTVALFGARVSGFGTGAEEVATSHEELFACYARDCAEAPNSVSYTLRDVRALPLTPGSGVCSCRLDIRTMVQNQHLRINGLRLTLAFALEEGSWRIRHMHLSLPTTEHGDNESYPIKELEERNAVLQRLVEERTRQLNDAVQEIRQLAVTDKLTGLNNRRMLDDLLVMEVERSRRYGNTFSVIMIDIDHFKQFNDAHGHAVGDDVLVEFASRVGAELRKSDMVGRWGGEEFLVICPETDVVQAGEVAEALRTAVAARPFQEGRRLSASFGVAVYEAGDTPEILIVRADMALYAAKHQGRNRVCLTEDVAVTSGDGTAR